MSVKLWWFSCTFNNFKQILILKRFELLEIIKIIFHCVLVWYPQGLVRAYGSNMSSRGTKSLLQVGCVIGSVYISPIFLDILAKYLSTERCSMVFLFHGVFNQIFDSDNSTIE